MSAWDIAKNGLKMLGNVVQGLEVIHDLTKLGGDRADQALATIAQVVHVLREGFEGKVPAATVNLELQEMHDTVRTMDERKLNKLREKFGIEGEPKP
jgi:hypothetical protein